MSNTKHLRPATRPYLVTWRWNGDLHTWTDFVNASTAKRAQRRVRKDNALNHSADFRVVEVLVLA